MVTRTSRFSHIMPILKSLRCLPVIYRINFKICCLKYRALSLGQPYYLPSLLTKDEILIFCVPHLLTPLLYNVPKKLQQHSLFFLTLHLFFGIIYLKLFILLLHTCPLGKIQKHIYLI